KIGGNPRCAADTPSASLALFDEPSPSTHDGRREKEAAKRESGGMASEELVTIGGAEIEVARRGNGKPLLLFPGEDMLEAESAFVAGLAKKFEVTLVSPLGFGRSSRPDWLTQPADQAYLLLSLLKKLGLTRVPAI